MDISTLILDKVRLYVSGKVSAFDPAHRYDHIIRVVGITKQICRHYEEANSQLAEMVALLHEMTDDKFCNEDSVNELMDFLAELELPEDLIQLILESIAYISYRKHPNLEDDIRLEVRIVQDADRIDAIGAIGVARTFAYGGAKGYALYTFNDEQPGVIQHFDDKLLLIYDLLNTDAAKMYARKRNDFIKLFYTCFLQELDEIYDR